MNKCACMFRKLNINYSSIITRSTYFLLEIDRHSANLLFFVVLRNVARKKKESHFYNERKLCR